LVIGKDDLDLMSIGKGRKDTLLESESLSNKIQLFFSIWNSQFLMVRTIILKERCVITIYVEKLRVTKIYIYKTFETTNEIKIILSL